MESFRREGFSHLPGSSNGKSKVASMIEMNRYHPAELATKEQAPPALIRLFEKATLPLQASQYAPARTPNVLVRAAKMVTKTTLVRRAQTKYTKQRNPIARR